MMGYNYYAPAAPGDENVINLYYGYLKEATPVRGETRNEPLAWIMANANALVSGTDYDTACAITNDYYYFIKYDSIPSPDPATGDISFLHYNRFVYAIKPSEWGKEFNKINKNNRVVIGKLTDIYSRIP